ncbi:hypothetical protein FOCC_FOCC011886 [Frankliniella occidentalis]|uniref:Adventurous-gliding motility protein Z-like n=1 Tax=Frankliniella occidentalis TaxID=133901 RepID=A0A9C6X1G8_FRAOC|nr:adventurous-gliding motility protein Z-like [Frankliniella occidentalis]KAE8742592.1 hypothetical protein FOCC_FOCC011886 [Frankliniella occidentalis]
MGAAQSVGSDADHHRDPAATSLAEDAVDDAWWGTPAPGQEQAPAKVDDDATAAVSETTAPTHNARDDVVLALARRVEDLTAELQRERRERQSHWREAVAEALSSRQRERREESPREEPPEDAGATTAQLSDQRRRELAMLRTQLGAHREARRLKLEAVSAEMERLRAELAAERALRERLEARDEQDAERHHQDAMAVEAEQLREDLARERDARAQVHLQALQLQVRCDELQAALDAADGDARRERDAAGSARLEVSRLQAEAAGAVEELTASREEAERVAAELTEVQRQAAALKEVAAISKRMLAIREEQVRDMKQQLTAIEEKVGGPDHQATTLSNLRAEYEKQIANIRGLKQLYEERARVLQQEKDKQAGDLEQRNSEVAELQDAIKELEDKASRLEASLSERSDALEELEFQLGDSVAECQSLTAQMERINGLFTQMLVGCSHPDQPIDLDRLSHLLHENHDLIADITVKGCGTDIAPVLPKLILDLITQVENEARLKQSADEEAASPEDGGELAPEVVSEAEQQPDQEAEEGAAPQNAELVNEIASNLPKVWAVLRELVSQQAGGGARRGSVGDSEKGKASCYTSVNTPGGPRNVISVSKTYIRLKDLIVEKRSLQRELGSLKQLNGHLETRLDEQENRLAQVSSELHKTWGLVGRLQAQHQQLHTHEKILRYELHQKRELLSELKQELEYCREKWESAREKNSQTDREWRQLRREFAARKARDATRLDDFNNSTSGESGLGEDSGEDDADVSSGRSETPSVAEDVPPGVAPSPSAAEEQDLVAAEPDLPVDTAAGSSTATVPILVSLAPQLEATEQDGELQSLELAELAPVRCVSTSACRVVTTEPLTATVVRSAAVVLQTEVVPAQHAVSTTVAPRRRVAEETDDARDGDAATRLSDLKARALVQYAQRVASLGKQDAPREEQQQQQSGQDAAQDTEDDEEAPKQELASPQVSPPDTPQDAALRPPPTREVPLFGALAGALPAATPGNAGGSPFLFGNFDVASVDFSLSDVAASLRLPSPPAPTPDPEERPAAPEVPPPPPPPPTPPPAPEVPRAERSAEEILAGRAARLQRLEQQADWLKKKVANTNRRGSALANKLEELHEQYGPAASAESRTSPRADTRVSATTATASTSSPTASATTPAERTPEEILAARAERLSRLEQQTSSLFSQMNRTSHIGNMLSNRLEELHEHYGQDASPSPPPPPPMPDALTAGRLPVTSPPPSPPPAPEADQQERP